MAQKSVRARIKDGFDATSLEEFGIEYVKLVLDRWRENTRAMRRAATFILLLAVGFTLLIGAKRAEFTLGPLKTTNVVSILPVVPAILSFLFYELLVLAVGDDAYDEIVREVFRRRYPAFKENDLEVMIAPATASLWGSDPWRVLRERPAGRLSRVIVALDSAVVFMLVVGSLVFQVFAFDRLYAHAHSNALVVSLALATTCFNLVRGLLVVVDEY